LVGAAGGTLRRPWYGSLPRDGEVLTFQGSDLADLRGVAELARSGALEVPLLSRPLAEVVDAYRELEAGGLAGRLVVQPSGG
ncbi:MAG: zinc-binding dehydrogenase, partial [Acidimicrobiales bacterium]|nr:zinc-binding dehydrogenase [Acidimicrobiales bacterium]